MTKYRKKPVTVDALQLTRENWHDMCEFADVGYLAEGKPEGVTEDDNDTIELRIPTLEGVMLARQGDWVIRGVQGELYPCKPDIFEATYERVDDHSNLSPDSMPNHADPCGADVK